MNEKWKKESDDYSFYHLNYKCAAHRQRTLKHWLGFVVVPLGHLWFGVDKAELLLPIHGGIAIADYCPFSPDPKQDEWWIGFECNQPFDIVPKEWEDEKDISPDFFKNHVYRDLEFVIEELKKLAKFAKQAESRV